MRFVILIVVLLVLSLPAAAQEAQRVEVPASNELMLIGDLYLPEDIPEEGAPAVLLMHMYNSRRSAYEPLIPALLENGYIVLNVDLRGHGETGGSRNWELALTDVQTWLDWLREQDGVRGESVAIIGGSIGSNLALMGCAADEQCVTAVALSPGLNYFEVKPEASVIEGLAERSVLLVASTRDTESAIAVRTMTMSAKGEVASRIYTGGTHGTDLFVSRLKSISDLILLWLNEHTAIEN